MVARFFFKLSWFAPLLLLVGGFNYAVDPANLFHSAELERQAARWLAEGQNVEGLGDYDDRKFQLYWLQGLKQPRKTAVVGSSHAMTISGSDILNHFVSGATLPDYLAIGQLYRERGWRPERLLVVADPWLFNRNNRETRWRSLYGSYSRARQAMGLQAGPAWLGESTYRLEVLGQLLSPGYFQASLESLARGRTRQQIRPTSAWDGEDMIKHTDGSVSFNRRSRESTVEAAREAAIQMVERPPVYGLERYEELDPQRQRELEAWLADWKRQGTEVELLLTPYHPEAYRRLMASPRFAMVAKAEEYLRSLGYPVYGSYAPTDGTDSDFYDGQHTRPEYLQRVLKGSGIIP